MHFISSIWQRTTYSENDDR